MIKVSFVVVALNSENTLPALFECLNRQTYPHNSTEVILVDGMSSDNTKRIMTDFSQHNDFMRSVVLENPGKTLPCGWNVALDAVEGDAVLRVDAHTTFPNDFIALNVVDLEKGEDICGGKVISIPTEKTKWAIAINEAENSMFGGSFATFRHADSARYVSTAAFAIYRKVVFDRVGRYNELLTRTEDNEMHYRMKQAGYKFYYDPKIISYRETRSTFRKLLKQKYLNGYWIGRTMAVEPRCFSLYHFVPFTFVIAIIITALVRFAGITGPMKVLWISYVVANVLMTLMAVFQCKERNAFFICLPIMFLLLHIWYGAGTMIGICNALFKKRKKHEKNRYSNTL